MNQTSSPRSPDAGDRTPAVEVDVARTGGIAGITRRWSAQPREEEASEWTSLLDRCPWDDVPAPDPTPTPAPTLDEALTREPNASADRSGREATADGFVWWIRATWSGTDPREAELSDHELVGAWRELVDAVRDWSRQSSASNRSAR